MTIESNTNTTIASELIFDRFHATYLIGYTLPTEESLHRIVVYLSSLNEEIPVSIDASVLSITLQGNVSQESTLQIIESTSTTTTMDSKSAGSITVDTTSSISFASNVLISTVSIETSVLNTAPQWNFTHDSTLQTIESTSPTTTDYRGTVIATSTTSSITGTACRSMKQTRTTDSQSSTHAASTTDTSSKSMIQTGTYYTSASINVPSTTINNSDTSYYKHLLIYVAVGGIIIIFILVTIIIGIIWYYRQKVKAQQFINNTVISGRNVFSLKNRSFSMRETEEKDYKQISQQQEEMREDDDTHECSDELMTNDDKILNLI